MTTLAIDTIIELIIDRGHEFVVHLDSVNRIWKERRNHSGMSEPVTEGSRADKEATIMK
jgi:hypothetical protein